MIAPRARQGVAGFPDDFFTGLRMGDPCLYLVLLGSPDILIELGAVVDDDMRLKRTGGGDQLLGFPIVFSLALADGSGNWGASP